MKTLVRSASVLWIALASLGVGPAAHGQEFINLDFEAGIVEPIGSTWPTVEWEEAVPGWSHSDGHDTTHLGYNNATHVGITQAYGLIGSPVPLGWPEPLEGTYSVMFRNGAFCTTCRPNYWVHAFVAQTGLVPADALSIQLKAEGPLSVFLDGVEIPIVSLGGNDYGGDISAYAGSISELRIQNSRPDPIMFPQALIIDAIEFSPIPIPEPAGGLLLFAGGLALMFRRQRQQ